MHASVSFRAPLHPSHPSRGFSHVRERDREHPVPVTNEQSLHGAQSPRPSSEIQQKYHISKLAHVMQTFPKAQRTELLLLR